MHNRRSYYTCCITIKNEYIEHAPCTKSLQMLCIEKPDTQGHKYILVTNNYCKIVLKTTTTQYQLFEGAHYRG